MLRTRRTSFLSLAIRGASTSRSFPPSQPANLFDAHAGNQLGYGTQNASDAHGTSMHYTLNRAATQVNTITGDVTSPAPAVATIQATEISVTNKRSGGSAPAR